MEDKSLEDQLKGKELEIQVLTDKIRGLNSEVSNLTSSLQWLKEKIQGHEATIKNYEDSFNQLHDVLDALGAPLGRVNNNVIVIARLASLFGKGYVTPKTNPYTGVASVSTGGPW